MRTILQNGGAMADFALPVIWTNKSRVFGIERMALLAMCLIAILPGRSFAAFQVDGVSDGLQMARIDAGRHTTGMIQFLSFGNRSDEEFVGNPVRTRQLAVNVKTTVSVLIGRSEPEPAACVRLWDHLGKKSFFEGWHYANYRAMSTTLEVKLQTAIAADSTLVSLLATASDGKPASYDMVEYQGSAFPALTLVVVSAVDRYSVTNLMTVAEYRVQFTVWDTDPQRARAVEQAIKQFLVTFNAYSEPNNQLIQPNRVVMRRQGGNAQTQPIVYWRIIDAMIQNNELL